MVIFSLGFEGTVPSGTARRAKPQLRKYGLRVCEVSRQGNLGERSVAVYPLVPRSFAEPVH